jgi:hypothetical protein
MTMPDDPLNINSITGAGPFGRTMCCSGDSARHTMLPGAV